MQNIDYGMKLNRDNEMHFSAYHSQVYCLSGWFITGLLYQYSYCVMSVVHVYGMLAVIPYFDPITDP